MSHPEIYRRLTGRLQCLNITRPDFSYAIQHRSQFLSQPRQPHYDAALHLVRYLKGTVNRGLVYPVQQSLLLLGFSDADWGRFSFSRRSLTLTAYCAFLGTALLSWKIKKQKTVSKSSAESKYRSMFETTSELAQLAGLLWDHQSSPSLPITLLPDNKADARTAQNPVFHNRTKYLGTDGHYVSDTNQEGYLLTAHVSSQS